MFQLFTKFPLIAFLSITVFSSLNAQVFWSEDFSSQTDFEANWTNGGTNSGAEVWSWLDDPTILLFGSQPAFGSTTADNGFIIFNSDGNGENAHDVTITSPVIDCSAQSQVFLKVENQYGYFSTGSVSVAQVGVSTNGTDFTYYDILTAVEQNDLSDAVQVEFLELPEAANEETVYIQFRWQGFFEYAWRIDDIELSSQSAQPANELVLEEPRVAFNFATPVSQIDTVFLAFGIDNNGTDDQFNVSATATVTGDNGDNFTTTESTDTLQSDSSVVFLFDESFVPSGEGNYDISYSTSSDSADANPDNNAVDLNFVISEDIFSKDDGIIASATRPATIGDDFWEIGNYYLIANAGFEAFEAQISVASNDNAHQGQQVTVFVYEVTEDDDVGNFTDDDLTVLGFGEYEFTTEANFDLVTVPLFDLIEGTQGIVLPEDSEIFMTIQYTPDMFVPYSDLAYYYDVATVVRGDDGGWFLGGFGPDITAIARMRIREEGTTATQEPQLDEDKLRVFPNPVDKQLTVEITLEEISEQVQVQLMSATGSILMENLYEGVKAERLNFNVEKYPAGTYFLNVRTAEGVRTQRFVIQR